MRRFWVIVAAVVVLIAVIAGLAVIMNDVNPRPPSRSISGTIDVRDMSALYKTDKKCVGFGDLRSGAPVRIANETGKLVGTSTLSDGLGGADPRTCIFAFIVDGLPNDNAYTVNIAGRAAITRSKAQLEANNWNMTLTASQ